jgi:serine/threonine protein kinase/TolB-like protein/Tfp pilus assembly protein PilF
MRPSIPQLALMSRLLDEALPLDAPGRRAWLERLSPEYQDLAPALRKALLSEDSRAADSKALETLPKLEFAGAASGSTANGLRPGERLGPYELIRLLGAGGMAQVWLARRADGAFKRDVALKLPMLTHLRADLEQRFARERDILASLEHPHIARFYDAGIDPNGLPYVAMEYVQGNPLTEWCDAHRLGISARLELLMQVLGGVQYAHEKHVIHRDLKPSNILVTESGQVRLLDFGVAKLLEAEETDQTSLTSIYGRALTPDYASPELLRGDPVDVRADVYSLGVLLYELLTGVRPYRLKSAASIGMLEHALATVDVEKPSTQHNQEAIAVRATTAEKLNRQLRGDLDAIALKALAKVPAERYASAAALAHDLRCYLDGNPIEAMPARFTNRLRKFVRRNRTVIGVTAIAVAAIVGMIGYTQHRETVTQARIAANAVAMSGSKPANAPATANLGESAAALSTHSVAVLAFVDMSEKKDQQYFSDGLSEELIELLSKTPDLRVPARTSSFYFKGKAEKLETIAAELRVANVLEGSVRKAGNKLRITALLIRADTSEHIWSETFDRDVRDVFKIQDEIAGAVVSALKVKLVPGKEATHSQRTSSPEAHNQYLLGRQFFERGTLDGFRRAAEAYRRAVELDPRYAGAYAGLAIVESFVADPSGDAAGQQQALAAADKAVEVGPDEADAYAVRSYMRLRRTWDWSGARADFEKALTYDSTNSALQWLYVTLLDDFGRLPEAIAAAKKATELDPLSAPAWFVLSGNLAANRQFAAAHEALRRALEIQPESPMLLGCLGGLQLDEGNATEALATFRQVSDGEVRLWGIARAEHTLGHAKESQEALDQFIANAGQAKAYDIAELYAWRGEKDKAFEWLNRAYQQRSSDLYGFRNNPDFASLRSDARFAAMLRKMNLPERD